MSATAAGGPRQTAEERRAAALDAATVEFARTGFHGTSTEDIARAAGISQPYLFRLFGSKKELYLAAARRGIEELYAVFAHAAEGKQGGEALHAMAEAYPQVIGDRDRLMLMLKCWTSCDDPDICRTVRAAWRDVVDLVERSSGASDAEIADFFARGMLITIFMSMNLVEDPEPWSQRLLDACGAALAGGRGEAP
jgi:AcrR family transcriptional regulator